MNLETDGAVYFETAAPSGNQVLNDLGMFNTCQFLIQTEMTICKSLMVEAKQVKHRGMKISNMHRIFYDVV